MRRIAITGIGAVTPVGVTADAMWQSISAGRRGITPITHFDASEYTSRIAGYVHDFDPSDSIDRKEARRMARFQQFAMVAADEAIADSGLEITDSNAERVGVIVGSGIGGGCAGRACLMPKVFKWRHWLTTAPNHSASSLRTAVSTPELSASVEPRTTTEMRCCPLGA